MNREELNHQDQLGKWIKESAHDHPSINFSETIINTIASQQQQTIYQPVISPIGLRIITTCILSICIYVLFFLPSGESEGVWSLKNIKFPNIHFAEYLFFPPIPSSNIILNSSLLAFSILLFFSMLLWSRRINKA